MKKASKGSRRYVTNWSDLADILGVTRRALQEWRKDPRYRAACPQDRTDGRKDVDAWRLFMVTMGLNRADEVVPLDESNDALLRRAAIDEAEEEERPRRTIQDWKMYKEELTCTEIERRIAKQDGELLEGAELEIAVGQLLAGVQTALSQFPGQAARFLVGIRDVHDVQGRLQAEIDAILTQLQLGHYLEDVVDQAIAAASEDPDLAGVFDKVLFAGSDRTALLELAKAVAVGALRAIGRRAVAQVSDTSEDQDEMLRDPVTGQVANGAGVDRPLGENGAESSPNPKS